jgi:hypothetical protein
MVRFSNPDNWYSIPSMGMIKAKPWHTLGYGILGLVDTSLIGMGIDYLTEKLSTGEKPVDIPEYGKDAVRIIGKLAGGSAISYMISRKDGTYASAHQLGVYVSTAFDVVGTSYKYINRYLQGAKPAETLKQPVSPEQPAKLAGAILGFGSIIDAYDEQKLLKALKMDGVVVGSDGNGRLALASAGTGNIIVQGSVQNVQPLIQKLKRVMFKQNDGKGGMGEDISIES